MLFPAKDPEKRRDRNDESRRRGGSPCHGQSKRMGKLDLKRSQKDSGTDGGRRRIYPAEYQTARRKPAVYGQILDPEQIKRELGMSKAAFKRAVGRLLKQGKIEIQASRIVEK